MRFHAEHAFDAPPEAVVAAMVDPGLYLALDLPDVSLPEVLGGSDRGDGPLLRLRYLYTGRIDPVARRIAGSAPLAWIQATQFESAACTGRLTWVSDPPGGRLRGEATITFVVAGERTTRRIEGRLTVSAPLFRGVAERSIVAGLLGRLDLEAAAIRQRVEAA